MQRLLNQSYFFFIYFFFMISTPLLIQWDFFFLSRSLCLSSVFIQKQMGEKCIRKQGRVIEGCKMRKEGKKEGKA